MTTNLVASILITLATNSTEHWPRVQQGTKHNPGWDSWSAGKSSHPYTLEYCPESIPNYVDDTNADTKSIEFVVTGRRLLSLEFEGHWELEMTNWTQAHYSVDYRRVSKDLIYWPEEAVAAMANHAPGVGSWQSITIKTNWFDPVATNRWHEPIFWSYLSVTNATTNCIFYGTNSGFTWFLKRDTNNEIHPPLPR